MWGTVGMTRGHGHREFDFRGSDGGVREAAGWTRKISFRDMDYRAEYLRHTWYVEAEAEAHSLCYF